MSTLVYSYGAKPPRVNADGVAQQISLAHRYYNRLIELRRKQYDAVVSLRRSMFSEFADIEERVAAADAAVEEKVADIRRRNASERRKRATAEEVVELKAIKQVRTDLWQDMKMLRERIKTDAVYLAALDRINVESHEAQLASRASCGVYWGTYLEVEKAIEAAVEKTKGLPKFRRWTGDGLVAVQIQKGMTAEEAFGGEDRRFVIGPAQDRGRRAQLRTVKIRIGSTGAGNRDPLWCEIPVYFHRPLPQDAQIMGIALIRRQVAVRRASESTWKPYYEWSLNITLRTGETKPVASDGACGVDLGWRLMPNGSLRVAYVVGGDGRKEEFSLPPELVARWRKCDDIQSIRDKHFDAIRALLGAQLQEMRNVPEWLSEATTTLHQWRSKGRLAKVLSWWTSQRFDGDEAMFAEVQTWQERDTHLWQYERHNRLKAQRIRKHMFRTFAARLRTSYARIAVEDCDWRKLAAAPGVDRNDPVNQTARYHQRIASVGELRGLLKSAGAVMVKTENTTRECALCGHINEWEDRKPLELTCGRCLATWDQDENAAAVLLARAAVMEREKLDKVAETPTGQSDRGNPADQGSRVPEADTENGLPKKIKATSNRWAARKAKLSREGTEGTGMTRS